MAELIQKENLDPTEFFTRASYHANRQPDNIRSISPIVLMPLFTESSNTGAMIMHAMKLVAQATQYLHPGQVPLITMDQPLYAIAKQIQWLKPNAFSEAKYVVIIGGLHIEINVMKLLGEFLNGSSWTSILV